MTPEAVFGMSSTAAMAGWVVLVLGPRRYRLINAVPQFLIPLGLSALYAALVLTHFSLPGGGYGSLAEVRQLFTSDWVLLAGWVHYLAFDLAIGAYLARRMDRLGIDRLVQAPLLLATFLFGPVGFLLVLLMEAGLSLRWPLPALAPHAGKA